MMYVQDGLYVTIEEDQATTAPLPKPLQNGFSRRFAYLVLGAFSLAESGEAFFILANNRDEIWFISNRHLRVHELLPESTDFRRRVTSGSPRASKPDSLGKNGAHPNAPPRRRPRKRRAKAGR
jgi:hypothetical protein